MLLFEFIYFPKVKSVYNHIKYHKNVLKQEQYLHVYIKMWMEITEAKKAYRGYPGHITSDAQIN